MPSYCLLVNLRRDVVDPNSVETRLDLVQAFETGSFWDLTRTSHRRSFGTRVRIHYQDLWEYNSTDFDLNEVDLVLFTFVD